MMCQQKRQFLTTTQQFVPHKRARYNPVTTSLKRKTPPVASSMIPPAKKHYCHQQQQQYTRNGSILTKVMYTKDEVDRILADRDNIIRAIKSREEQTVRYLKEENDRLREQICKLVRGDNDALLAYNYCQ